MVKTDDFQSKIVVPLESGQHCGVLLLVGYLQFQRKHFQQKLKGIVLLTLSSCLLIFGLPQPLTNNVEAPSTGK